MGRKFGLHHKKQKYGTTSLVVSIPRSTVSVATIPMDTLPNPGRDDGDVLPISLPLSLYTTGSVQSLDLLQDRIMQAGLLPPGTTHLILSSVFLSCLILYSAYCRLDCIGQSSGSGDDRTAGVLQATVSVSWVRP